MAVSEGTIALCEVATPKGDPQEALRSHHKLFEALQKQVTPNGSMWLFARDYYADNQLVPWPLIIADYLRTWAHFRFKNVLLHYSVMEPVEGKRLLPAHTSILFMVKPDGKYFFDKGPIREPHIFKDIEWGKRATGTSGYHEGKEAPRYPEGGRDPGNVFYRTKRDEQGYILDVYEYPLRELCEKLVLVSSEEDWSVLTNIEDSGLDEAVRKNKRHLVRLK